MIRRITMLVAAALLALTMSFGSVAFAKITPVDTACTKESGNPTPGGQQPSCKGGGNFEQESENQNPSGKAPPGQNKPA
jgi:hypothetical protein